MNWRSADIETPGYSDILLSDISKSVNVGVVPHTCFMYAYLNRCGPFLGHWLFLHANRLVHTTVTYGITSVYVWCAARLSQYHLKPLEAV